MSLVDFIKEPEARAIHDRHVAKKTIRLPPWEHVVPCADTRLAGAIGTAFDYMVRFRLHALCTKTSSACMEGEWIAEAALAAMRADHSLTGWIPHWERLLAAARRLQAETASGSCDIEPARLAKCAQYLGAADLLIRVGAFRPDFRHSDAVTAELVLLDGCFDYQALLPSAGGSLYLNPSLPAGRNVGGADPDIISERTVVDIKTTVRPSADAARLRQVCAYAALCDTGGVSVMGTSSMLAPMTHVGFSFARQNLHVRYSLDEVFDGRYGQYRAELMDHALRRNGP